MNDFGAFRTPGPSHHPNTYFSRFLTRNHQSYWDLTGNQRRWKETLCRNSADFSEFLRVRLSSFCKTLWTRRETVLLSSASKLVCTDLPTTAKAHFSVPIGPVRYSAWVSRSRRKKGFLPERYVAFSRSSAEVGFRFRIDGWTIIALLHSFRGELEGYRVLLKTNFHFSL